MIRRSIAFAFCAIVLSGPASAETADAAAIANCIANATRSGKSGSACIGAIADPCIAVAQKSAEYEKEAKACASRERAVWSNLLLSALKKAKAAGEPSMPASLESAQRSWTSSQNALCATFNNLDPGATLGGSEYCRLLDTAERALILEKLAGAISEH